MFFKCQFMSLCKKCPYSEILWSVFSRIRTEYEDLLRKSPYSVRMREKIDRETPNVDIFHAVNFSIFLPKLHKTFGRRAGLA